MRLSDHGQKESRVNDKSKASSVIFLTEAEVAARYRGEISPGTLRNWRSQRRGPPFVKVGRAVLYPVASLECWEQDQTSGTASG